MLASFVLGHCVDVLNEGQKKISNLKKIFKRRRYM